MATAAPGATSATKKRCLVVDTGAIIKGAKLERMGFDVVYTIQEVLDEVRDAQARQNLAALPVDLVVKEPDEKAMAAVVAFSKKTGDLGSLSKTDMKVLALHYQMERETNGVDHLYDEPIRPGQKRVRNRVLQWPSVPVQEVTMSSFMSALSGPESGQSVSSPSETSPQFESYSQNKKYSSARDAVDISEKSFFEKAPIKLEDIELDADEDEDEDVVEGGDAQAQESQPESPNVDSKGKGKEVVQDVPKLVGEDEVEAVIMDEAEGGEWITPDNIDRFGRYRAGEIADRDGSAVAALNVASVTTDFSMQNVILQMGMQLLSVDGCIIRQVKTFVLRCTACYKICKDSTRKFCPTCGNASLKKVAMYVDKKGEIRYSQGKRTTTRGMKYSIPLPKGGRNGSNVVLREDEYVQKTRGYRTKRTDVDAFDIEYSFADKKAGPHSNVQIGFGKRNPNERRRVTGKKKNRS